MCHPNKIFHRIVVAEFLSLFLAALTLTFFHRWKPMQMMWELFVSLYHVLGTSTLMMLLEQHTVLTGDKEFSWQDHVLLLFYVLCLKIVFFKYFNFGPRVYYKAISSNQPLICVSFFVFVFLSKEIVHCISEFFS